jgi:hypothetical protein
MAKRILLGDHPNFGYGLFISKSGKDVHTNLAARDLLFDSRTARSTLVHQQGFGNIPANTAYADVPISPSLSYIPLVLYCSSDSSGVYREKLWFDSSGISGTYEWLQITGSNIRFANINYGTAFGARYFAYLVFRCKP